MDTLSPARIMEVGMAFWPAKVLLSAIELGLFTELGARSMTGRELQLRSSVTSESQSGFLRHAGGASLSRA